MMVHASDGSQLPRPPLWQHMRMLISVNADFNFRLISVTLKIQATRPPEMFSGQNNVM